MMGLILAFFRKPLGLAVGALIVLGLLFWGYRALTADARTEARLARNQAEAALESGRDAVGTVGAQGAAEDEVDRITEENEDDIRNADGADAPVADGAHAAGIRSLCRRAANRSRPECLQHAPAP